MVVSGLVVNLERSLCRLAKASRQRFQGKFTMLKKFNINALLLRTILIKMSVNKFRDLEAEERG